MHRSGTGQRMRHAHSNRDIYGATGGTYDSYRSTPRSGHPIVEFPPTLPRHGYAPAPPPHQNNNMAMMKSRSMHDWEMQGGPPTHHGGSRLQRDFEESLLMPMPSAGDRLDKRDHRTEPLPGGGQESLARHVKADSGKRSAHDGRDVDYKWVAQSYGI